MLIKSQKEEFIKYNTDASNYKGSPLELLIPENQNEVLDAINYAKEKGENLTIYGGGTGLTGAAVAQNSIAISTEKLNNFKIHKESKIATVEPGVIYSDLDLALKQESLFLPPNPTETSSTLGGNIGTNASGSRTFKYGAMRDYVLRLKIALSDGEILEINRGEISEHNGVINLISISGKKYKVEIRDIQMPNIKNASGYFLKKGMDAIDLFIGSEGTLGFILEADIRVADSFDNILGLIIYFDDNNKMLDFIEEIREESISNHGFDIEVIGGISARLIEYFDERSLNVLRKHFDQIPIAAKSGIWIEQEYFEDNEPLVLESWSDLIQKYTNLSDETWSALNEKEHKFFATFRHKLPEEVYENLSSGNHKKIGTDSAVPKKHFREYYHYLNDGLEKLNIPYLVFGHIGNCHLHANIFYNDEEGMNNSLDFYNEFMQKSIKLGGTVSAEHGIGKLKRKYLNMMYDKEAINDMLRVKETLDQIGLFGKGNLF